MIGGLGVDIVRVSRVSAAFSRYGRRFVQKFMHEQEIARSLLSCLV